MKRPKHMTMRELVELPVLRDRDQSILCRADEEAETDFGGAFQDEDGYVWGTLKLENGWVRYPTYMSLFG